MIDIEQNEEWTDEWEFNPSASSMSLQDMDDAGLITEWLPPEQNKEATSPNASDRFDFLEL